MKEERDFSQSVISAETPDQPPVVVIAAGGAGKDSAQAAYRYHQAAGKPFPVETFAIDTDNTGFDAFDGAVHIAPTPEAVSGMAANPDRHGPGCQALVQRHPHLLDSETLGRGARTHRILTQAGFELFIDKIIEGIRDRIHSLIRQNHSGRIQPVFVGSFGGGTGAALAILLLDLLLDPLTRGRILLGLPPDILARPVAFVIDAYAHALQQANDVAFEWILANIYATRTELAEYEKRGRGYEYVFHLGLGNDAGAVFPSIARVSEANGLLLWTWMANYPAFKARAVDAWDFYKETCRYRGDDIPERCFPREEWPAYAGDGH